jgi:putative phosphotransacetylase
MESGVSRPDRTTLRRLAAAAVVLLLLASVTPTLAAAGGPAGQAAVVASPRPARAGVLARVRGKLRGVLNTLHLCRIRTPVNMSNRHWHPTSEAFRACFGDLKPDPARMKPLSQPGEFATDLKVDLRLGDGKIVRGVRVLWPPRDKYASGQAELAPTDFASIGLRTPAVNDSGDHRDTIGATVVGAKGSFVMKEGVMAAAPHVHVSALYALRNGLRDGERVDLVVNGSRRTTFHDAKIRINPRYPRGAVSSDAHIDKDQAGAAVWEPGTAGYIQKQSPLRRFGRWLRGR